MNKPTKAIILTGSETRHVFFRKALSINPSIEVVKTYCEGEENSLRTLTHKEGSNNSLRIRHVQARENSENDFFSSFCLLCPDESHPFFLPKGDINNINHVEDIQNHNPDILVAYGCSIIREPLLSMFSGRFLNVHLGLSPYYRGSGTNFWPLVDERPEFVGATFMHINEGVDSGEIIHQIRARIFEGDTPHQIGNRLLCDVVLVYADIISKIANLRPMPQPLSTDSIRYCRRADFSEDSVKKLYQSFEGGIVDRYLRDRERRCKSAPIVVHPNVTDVKVLNHSRK